MKILKRLNIPEIPDFLPDVITLEYLRELTNNEGSNKCKVKDISEEEKQLILQNINEVLEIQGSQLDESIRLDDLCSLLGRKDMCTDTEVCQWEEKQKEGMSGSEIAGIILMIIGGIGLISVIIWILVRKYKTKKTKFRLADVDFVFRAY